MKYSEMINIFHNHPNAQCLLLLFILKLQTTRFNPYRIIIREYTHQVLVYKTSVANSCTMTTCAECSRSECDVNVSQGTVYISHSLRIRCVEDIKIQIFTTTLDVLYTYT
jgi:hypothetical protein